MPDTGLERLSLNCNPIISLSSDSSGDGALRGVSLHLDLKPEVQTPLPNAASVISTKKVSSSALHPVTAHGKNVVQCLERLATMPSRKNVLKKLDYSSIKLQTVKFLPPQFDGDVLFHFPPVGDSAKHSKAKFMEGMDKQYDGHMWTKMMTTNISNKMGLSFRSSNCVGHLRCANPSCDFLARTHRTSTVNETEFEGSTTLSFLPGFPPPSGSILVCKICKEPPTCIATCSAVIYYVHGDATMTRAYVHLGEHRHPVKTGDCRSSRQRIDALIQDHVEKAPQATRSAIVLEASKDMLGDFLLRNEDEAPKVLSLEELEPVFDCCKDLSSPSIRNRVVTFKYLRRFGEMDAITKLRGLSNWAFVQRNMFPGQGNDSDKVFVFKMLELGPGSGVDLVKRM